jgi:hypothetical protein
MGTFSFVNSFDRYLRGVFLIKKIVSKSSDLGTIFFCFTWHAWRFYPRKNFATQAETSFARLPKRICA